MADDQAKGGLIPKLVEVPQLPLPEKIPVRELPPEALELREDMADFARKQMAFAEGIDAENAAPPDFETKATIRGEAMLNNPALMARVGRMQGEYGVPRNDVLAWEDINNAPTTMEKALRAAQFSRSKGDAFARFADHMFGAYNTETQADTQRRNASVAAGTTGSGQVLGSHTDELRRATDVDTNNARNETSVNVANQGALTAEYEANRRQADEANEPSVVDKRYADIVKAKDRPLGMSRVLTTSQVMGIDINQMTPELQRGLADELVPAITENLFDLSEPITKGLVDEIDILLPKGMEFNDFVSSLGIRAGTNPPPEVVERIRNIYKRVTGKDAPMNDPGLIAGALGWRDATPNNTYFETVPEENIDNMPPQQ